MQNNITCDRTRKPFLSFISNSSHQTIVDARISHEHEDFCNSQISKSEHYKIVEMLMRAGAVTDREANILKAFIYYSDFYLVSRASIQTICAHVDKSRSTVLRACAQLAKAGFLQKEKNGWKQTNTTSLKVVQHVLSHKGVILKHIYQYIINLIDLNININNINNCVVNDLDNYNEYAEAAQTQSYKRELDTKDKIFDDLRDLDLDYRSKQTITREITRQKLDRRRVIEAVATTLLAKNKVAQKGNGDAFNTGGYFMKLIMKKSSDKMHTHIRMQDNSREIIKMYDEQMKERVGMPSDLRDTIRRLSKNIN